MRMYVLQDKVPVFEPNALAWNDWMNSHHTERQVGYDMVGDVYVSTIFTGLDGSMFQDGVPLVFETMVRNTVTGDVGTMPYHTWSEARAGHLDMVGRVISNNLQSLMVTSQLMKKMMALPTPKKD